MTELISRGAKVRATWTTTIEGIYDGQRDGTHGIVVFEGPRGGFVQCAPAHASIIVLLHDEPNLKSIVVDNDGDAWQRCGVGWRSGAAGMMSTRTWKQLNEDFGPITFLYST